MQMHPQLIRCLAHKKIMSPGCSHLPHISFKRRSYIPRQRLLSGITEIHFQLCHPLIRHLTHCHILHHLFRLIRHGIFKLIRFLIIFQCITLLEFQCLRIIPSFTCHISLINNRFRLTSESIPNLLQHPCRRCPHINQSRLNTHFRELLVKTLSRIQSVKFLKRHVVHECRFQLCLYIQYIPCHTSQLKDKSNVSSNTLPTSAVAGLTSCAA